MNEKREQESKKPRKKKLRLGHLMYHNSFVLAFSFTVALIGWFVMAAGSDLNRIYVIKDVPINIGLSAEAEADGLRVFGQNYDTVDIEVSGSNLITSKLTAEDFSVTATLNPVSTKLTENTTQKYAAEVRVSKKNSYSDFDIVSRNPEEINIEYDKYRELSLPLETNIVFTADTGFFPGTPVPSEETIIISGPASSVNKVSHAVVAHTYDSPLRASEELTCPVKLYDQDNQEITDPAGIYLTLSVDSVQVQVPVLPRKTVDLVVSYAHKPAGFSESRISVEPKTIDIVATTQEALDAVQEIRLDTIIDFADLDLSARTASFTMEIPIPAGTRSINSTGDNSVDQAVVTINLNGYRQAAVSVPESNVELINPPGEVEAQLTTRSLEVKLAGPEAQVSKLTGDAVTVQVDMSNIESRTGSVDVPATVTVTGSAGEACWVLGSYTVTVTLAPSSSSTVPGRSSSPGATPAE